MRLLTRLLAATALVVGSLALAGGTAQAAACSGTTGVTVVIDYGSSSTTLCSPGDPATAGGALEAVAAVTYVPMYGKGVVCKINSVPSNANCSRMPPSSAYWAFFHAQRGGSWVYSSSGVASYNPPAGSVVGFAFGSGGAPSTAPPPASAPKPSPKPSPSSTSSRPTPPSSTSSSTRPRSSSPSTPRGSVAVLPDGRATTVPATRSSKATTTSTTTSKPPSSNGTTATTGSSTTTTGDATTEGTGDGAGQAMSATSGHGGAGSKATLWGGLGLVALLGAAAAYLARRRRAQH